MVVVVLLRSRDRHRPCEKVLLVQVGDDLTARALLSRRSTTRAPSFEDVKGARPAG